jgi:hypothetical protein
MEAIEPSVLAVIGTAMVVIATLLTQITAARADRRRKETQSQISEIDRKLEDGLQGYLRSSSTLDFAKVFEFLEKSIYIIMGPQPSPTSPPLGPALVTPQELDVIADTVMQRKQRGLVELYGVAISEPRLTQQQVNDWYATIEAERAGQQPATTTAQLIDELVMAYFKKRTNLTAERARLTATDLNLDLRAERIRYVGTTFQVLGLIVVLLKDLVTQG